MKRKQIFYTLVMAAGLLTACGEDDERIPAEPQTQSAADGGQAPADLTRHISVEVSERPMAEEGTAEGRSLTTRAAITTTETLVGFTMKGVYDGSTNDYSVVKKSAGNWTVDPNTWPTYDNTKVQFYAYTNGTFYLNDGTPFIDFTVAEDALKQHDLLVATNSVAFNDHNGTVPLIFDHACAAVQFYVYKEESTTYVVKSIVLRKVKNTGKYHYNSRSWFEVSGEAYYTLTDGDITPSSTPTLLPCEWMFFIPQDKSAIDIEVTYTKGGGAETTKTLHLTSGTWEAGHQYTVNIKIGK